MSARDRWLLPEGIEEVLPPAAAQLDRLCREVIDLHGSWGYELVMPPLVEFLEALLTGTGEDLDLQTFKVTDQLTGRMMGIRADTTPQVARIDAHYLQRELPTRLCYLGTVLHTRPDGPGGTRAPLQVGAELYGHAGRESEAEILALMLATLALARVGGVHVDLGHNGIFNGLVEALGLGDERSTALFDILQRKARGELDSVLKAWSIPAPAAAMLRRLPELHGAPRVLEEARRTLAPAGRTVLACVDELERTVELTLRLSAGAPLFVDLAELRGYRYHTGLTFAVYAQGAGQGIAFGGRYDDIGRAFGRPRPAVGFSADMKQLFALGRVDASGPGRIFAPCSELPGLPEAVAALRASGEVVIGALPGQSGGAAEMGCDRELVLQGGKWKVRQL
jgi:ATP phosphoribosyltransferase regulatory subunit